MATISITQDQLFLAVWTYLTSIIDCPVIRGLQNRTPEPLGDFIVMTPLFQKRLSTNENSFSDPTPTTGTQNSQQSIQWTVQLDCHGMAAANRAAILTTLLRDSAGCDGLAPLVQPLYCEDPHQMPFINGEQQYEEVWSIDAVFQYNPVVTTPMQFFATATVGIIEVDVTYPP